MTINQETEDNSNNQLKDVVFLLEHTTISLRELEGHFKIPIQDIQAINKGQWVDYKGVLPIRKPQIGGGFKNLINDLLHTCKPFDVLSKQYNLSVKEVQAISAVSSKMYLDYLQKLGITRIPLRSDKFTIPKSVFMQVLKALKSYKYTHEEIAKCLYLDVEVVKKINEGLIGKSLGSKIGLNYPINNNNKAVKTLKKLASYDTLYNLLKTTDLSVADLVKTTGVSKSELIEFNRGNVRKIDVKYLCRYNVNSFPLRKDISVIEDYDMEKRNKEQLKAARCEYTQALKKITATMHYLTNTLYNYDTIGKQKETLIDSESVKKLNEGLDFVTHAYDLGVRCYPISNPKKHVLNNNEKLATADDIANLVYDLHYTNVTLKTILDKYDTYISFVHDFNVGYRSHLAELLPLIGLNVTYPIRPAKGRVKETNFINSAMQLSIEQRLKQGYSCKAVADNLGVAYPIVVAVSRASLSGYTGNNNVNASIKYEYQTVTMEQVLQVANLLLNTTKPQVEIAKELNISTCVVSYVNTGTKFKSELEKVGIYQFPLRIKRAGRKKCV